MKRKVYFITGAANGIGRQLALDLSRRENSVIGLLDFENFENLKRVEENCILNGSEVKSYFVDARKHEELNFAVLDFLSKFHSIDVVFANAGVASVQKNEFDYELILRDCLEINLISVVNIFESFIPRMKVQKSGILVISNSISSLVATQSSGAYSASKSAIRSWSNSRRLQLKPFGIKIIDCTLGFIDTRMISELPHAKILAINVAKASKKILKSIERNHPHPSIPFFRNLIWVILANLPNFARNVILQNLWKFLNR